MKNKSRWVLSMFLASIVSACHGNSLSDLNLFDRQENVQVQKDSIKVSSTPASLTPSPAITMPVAQEQSTVPNYNNMPGDYSSVEIFDMEPNPAYNRNGPVPYSKAMEINDISTKQLVYGEAFSTNDTSVTVYGMDDMAPDMAASPYGEYNTSASVYDDIASPAYTRSNSDKQIFFKHGSDRLGNIDKQKISGIAEQAAFAPVNYITVEGYASRPTQAGSNSTESHIINLRQSIKRSEKVSQALISEGVPGEKIKTVGWGATKSTGNDQYDRRVDITLGEK